MKMSSFTIWLLGLETEIFAGIDTDEKLKYNRISKGFLLLLGLSFIGIFRFFDYAFQNAFVSNLASLTLLLVVFTMYRFSLVTYRKSVYEYIANNENVETIVENEPNNLNIQHNVNKKAKIGAFGSSMLLRLLIFLPLSFLIVFALSTYFNADYVEKICHEQNLKYKFEAIQVKQSTFDKKNKIALLKSKDIENTLQTLELANRQNTVLYKLKIQEKLQINNYLKQDSIDFKKAIQSIEIIHQQDQKYLLLLFQAMNKTAAYWILIIFFNLLFFFIHYELYSLKTDENYQYAQLSTKAYRELISKNYQVAMDEANSFVKKYKKFELPLNYSKEAFLDPPFCQIPKYTNTPKEKIAITKLPQIINTNSQI